MFIKTFPVGAFQCNCTIIGDEETGDAFVIDPGDEADTIIAELETQKFTVKYIIHTHAHIDHIGATKEVKNKCSGEICLHKGDTPLYDNMAMQAQVLGVNMDCDVLPVSKYIEHKDMLECHPEFKTEVIFTPGHTPGSVCFLFRDVPFTAKDGSVQKRPLLFSGDTLFQRSIGRTDLWGGDYDQILSSIRSELFTLPEETLVVPGHGPQTLISEERAQNPFLNS